MLNQRSAWWGVSVKRIYHDVQQPALKKLTAMNFQFRLSLSIHWEVPECQPHTGQQHVLTVSHWNVFTEIIAIGPSHWSQIHVISHDFSEYWKALVPHDYQWGSRVRTHTVSKHSLSEKTLISFQQRHRQWQSPAFLSMSHNFSHSGIRGL